MAKTWRRGGSDQDLRKTRKRDSSRKMRGWGGGPQRKRREIHPAECAGWGGGPPYAARRANNARKKKPACSVRNGRAGLGGAGYPGLTAFVALRVRPEGLTYDCDARAALQSGWRDELAATRIG